MMSAAPTQSPPPEKNQRTLIISPNWIGDAVIAQPLLQLLKQQHPERPIDVMAPTWVAPVWRAMSEVDTVLEAPFKHGMLQLRERWKFARQLRQHAYAAAYVLPNTLKFALIPWLAGIPRRVGYRGEMRYGFLNVVHHNSGQVPRPMVSFYAALANPPTPSAPEPAALPRPILKVAAPQLMAAEQQLGLPPGSRLVAFAPGAEFGSAKRWPASHFSDLAKLVRTHAPDVHIVLLGSPKDREVCDEIVAAAPWLKNFAGVTSLDQAIAMLARADAVVSNDSGLMNIASALNRPVIALYGPTDSAHTPPFSDVAKILNLHLDCSPCKQRECPLGHHHCMRNMSAAMAWTPLQEMLALPR